jgi:Icc-related predicted phosphoesterase
MSTAKIPVLGVLGNHDFEGGKQDEITQILCDAGMIMLDGDAHEIAGVGFAGAKGFCGGFGRGTLAPWGEEMVKRFVQEAIDEALKLEKAVARLRTPERVVLLHYAPVQATVEGEPPEIFPFLGTSRLEEPLGRHSVTAVFHGHAHRGTFEGRSTTGIPVYNVSLPLVRRQFPDGPPFYVLEVEAAPAPVDTPQEAGAMANT